MHYFCLMPNNRMLFGMRGGLFSAPSADARMHRNIRQHFDTMFPAWRHVETSHSWHRLLSIARDLTPFAGPIDTMLGAFTAISYHGNLCRSASGRSGAGTRATISLSENHAGTAQALAAGPLPAGVVCTCLRCDVGDGACLSNLRESAAPAPGPVSAPDDVRAR